VSQSGAELDFSVADLFILLERDVATNHVVQQDTQGPNCGGIAVISAVSNPFWWGVHSGAVKVCVSTVLQVGSRSEVNQFQFQGAKIHEQVFIFEIPVDHSFAVASNDGLNNLPEEVPGQLFFQLPALGDEVKEIFARRGFVHDINKGVVSFIEVEQLNDSRNNLYLRQ